MMRHVAANTLTLLILGLVLLFGLIVWGQSQFRAAGPLTAPLRFEVERGEGLSSVADKLAAAGAIGNASVFRIGARYAALEDGMRFGEYEFPAGISMEGILRAAQRGRQRRAAGDRAGGLDQLAGGRGAEGARGPGGRDRGGAAGGEPGAGGLRLPARRGRGRRCWTGCGRSRSEILAEAWAGRDPELPVASPEELLVLASIVEKETALPEERGRIAGVFANRLRRGMRLQTDPR